VIQQVTAGGDILPPQPISFRRLKHVRQVVAARKKLEEQLLKSREVKNVSIGTEPEKKTTQNVSTGTEPEKKTTQNVSTETETKNVKNASTVTKKKKSQNAATSTVTQASRTTQANIKKGGTNAATSTVSAIKTTSNTQTNLPVISLNNIRLRVPNANARSSGSKTPRSSPPSPAPSPRQVNSVEQHVQRQRPQVSSKPYNFNQLMVSNNFPAYLRSINTRPQSFWRRMKAEYQRVVDKSGKSSYDNGQANELLDILHLVIRGKRHKIDALTIRRGGYSKYGSFQQIMKRIEKQLGIIIGIEAARPSSARSSGSSSSIPENIGPPSREKPAIKVSLRQIPLRKKGG
jgi:hypothetical protein